MPDRPVVFDAFERLLNERNIQREHDMDTFGMNAEEVAMNENPIIFDMDRMKTGQIPDSHRMSDPFSSDNPYGRSFAPDDRTSKYRPTAETKAVQNALYKRANDTYAQAHANYRGHLERMETNIPGRSSINMARSILEPANSLVQDDSPTSWLDFINGVAPEHRHYYERLGELARRKQIASDAMTASAGEVADHIGRLRETRSATMDSAKFGRAATEADIGRASARLGRLGRMAGRVLGVAATIGSVDSINKAIFGSGEAFE